jgi:hypothetical protein
MRKNKLWMKGCPKKPTLPAMELASLDVAAGIRVSMDDSS